MDTAVRERATGPRAATAVRAGFTAIGAEHVVLATDPDALGPALELATEHLPVVHDRVGADAARRAIALCPAMSLYPAG